MWLMVDVLSLQRAQEPTNLHASRLHRRLSGGEGVEVRGSGIRGANLSLRGHTPIGKAVVHLTALCKSDRSQVSFSYSAGTLAAAHSPKN
eukprot:1602924-Pyramimonas_sp.AAC.1